MDKLFLIKGIIIGFSVAAPVGPMGILCIRRSLHKGPVSGFLTGLGAASADTVYGIVAAFGLTFISSFLVKLGTWLQVIGILFLLYLGVKYLFEEAQEHNKEGPRGKGLAGDYLSAFFFTLTNPVTILSFAAIFAALGLAGGDHSYSAAPGLILGIFLGSMLWWLILSSTTGIIRTKTSSKILSQSSRVAGIILIAFAIYLAISLL